MNLAFITSLCPAAASGKRAILKIKPCSLNFNNATCKVSIHRKFSCSATVATNTTRVSVFEMENKKQDLLRAVQDPQRGLVTSADQRSLIEESLVSLEGYNMGAPINLGKLDGTWRLQYTSAPYVLILLESAARLPFFQEQDGATLLVSAKFDVISVRNIYLQFEELSIQSIKISEELQALIAPAILPCSFFSLQGGLYYLSHLDGNMLLGRAVGGGVFVFTKA